MNHVLGDIGKQIGLPAMVIQLPVHAIDFHIVLATLKPLRVNRVLTLRNVALVMQLCDVRFQAFDHLRRAKVVAPHDRLLTMVEGLPTSQRVCILLLKLMYAEVDEVERCSLRSARQIAEFLLHLNQLPKLHILLDRGALYALTEIHLVLLLAWNLLVGGVRGALQPEVLLECITRLMDAGRVQVLMLLGKLFIFRCCRLGLVVCGSLTYRLS